MLIVRRLLAIARNHYQVRRISTHSSYHMILVPTYRCSFRCQYCFTHGLENDFPADMSVADLTFALRWMVRNRIKIFSLSGGEPSEYRYFHELPRLLEAYGLRVVFTSNNLFPPPFLELLPRAHVEFVLLHYNAGMYTQAQRARFQENLREFRGRRFEVGLQVVLHSKMMDDDVFDLAARYKCEIHLTTACPGYMSSMHVSKENLRGLSGAIIGFVRKCRIHKIKVIFSRPIIPCSFTREELRLLRPAAVRFRCNAIPVVNPDLSVFPCLSIFKKHDSLRLFKGIKEMRQRVGVYMNSLRRIPLFDCCVPCRYFQSGACQGGCLSYKYPAVEHDDGGGVHVS